MAHPVYRDFASLVKKLSYQQDKLLLNDQKVSVSQIVPEHCGVHALFKEVQSLLGTKLRTLNKAQPIILATRYKTCEALESGFNAPWASCMCAFLGALTTKSCKKCAH
jgi:hypothetical protein